MNIERPPISTPSVRRRRSASLRLYVYKGGEKLGPYRYDEVRRQLVNGVLSLQDYVWHNRLPKWIALQDLSRTEEEGDKYAMPRPPQEEAGLVPVAPEPMAIVPPPEKSRWWSRFLSIAESAPRKEREEPKTNRNAILSRLRNGHLNGVTIAPGKELRLACTTLRGRQCVVKMAGLVQLRVLNFCEVNQIGDISLYRENNAPLELLVKLTRREDITAHEVTLHYRLGRRGWNLLYFTTLSGCEVVALLDRSASRSGMPGEEGEEDEDEDD